jgi:serine/threonine-protein kinase
MSQSFPPPLSQRMPFPPGTVLAGKYRVERLLGEGGMGWVVEATHVQLEQRVAIKFMHAAQTSDNSEAIARFLREARAAARIQSEHVARVSDFGTLENGAPYLVMEYLEGRDLDSLLRVRGALPNQEVIDYAMQACEGLAEAHAAGIVHRDLKPANLFLARRIDGSVRVKLLDFGISKLSAPGGTAQAAMTNTQALMGSPLYMAPEQLRSSKNVDSRADIWSLGVILYEMLGGRPPFDGETLPVVCARIMTETPEPLRAMKPQVPPALEAVVMRCLEREAKDRFQDVAALARALAPFGMAEARVAAERIGRFVRARTLSSPEVGSDVSPTSSSMTGDLDTSRAAPRGVSQTRATFSKTGRTTRPQRGTRILPLAMAGGGLLIAVAVAVGMASTRGHSKVEGHGATSAAPDARSATAAETLGATPSRVPTPVPESVPANTTAPASATAAAPAPAPATPTPTPTSIGTASRGKPTTPSTAQPRPVPQPKPAASAPKAASTAGFGGRD